MPVGVCSCVCVLVCVCACVCVYMCMCVCVCVCMCMCVHMYVFVCLYYMRIMQVLIFLMYQTEVCVLSCISRVMLQGGEDSPDALSCKSFFRKRATNYRALL